MSAAISVRFAVSASDFATPVRSRVASFYSFIDATART